MKHNLNDEIHENDTRRRFNFHIGLNVANDYGRLSVMHQGLTLFNALPIALKTENNFEKFKKKLKLHEHLLRKQKKNKEKIHGKVLIKEG
jgi:hypothetical protein